MFSRAAALAGILLVVSAGAASAAVDRPAVDRGLIVGGTLASTSEVPWAIALTNSGSPLSTGRWCGAALLKANKIITAAHCMTQPVATYTAIQGRAELDDEETGRTSAIKSVWVHPGYNRKNNRNDFAILTLARPFTGVPVIRLETNPKADRRGRRTDRLRLGRHQGHRTGRHLPEARRPRPRRRRLPGEQGVRRQRVRRELQHLRRLPRRRPRRLPG
jgi:hypothetical protein